MCCAVRAAAAVRYAWCCAVRVVLRGAALCALLFLCVVLRCAVVRSAALAGVRAGVRDAVRDDVCVLLCVLLLSCVLLLCVLLLCVQLLCVVLCVVRTAVEVRGAAGSCVLVQERVSKSPVCN